MNNKLSDAMKGNKNASKNKRAAFFAGGLTGALKGAGTLAPIGHSAYNSATGKKNTIKEHAAGGIVGTVGRSMLAGFAASKAMGGTNRAALTIAKTGQLRTAAVAGLATAGVSAVGLGIGTAIKKIRKEKTLIGKVTSKLNKLKGN